MKGIYASMPHYLIEFEGLHRQPQVVALPMPPKGRGRSKSPGPGKKGSGRSPSPGPDKKGRAVSKSPGPPQQGRAVRKSSGKSKKNTGNSIPTGHDANDPEELSRYPKLFSTCILAPILFGLPVLVHFVSMVLLLFFNFFHPSENMDFYLVCLISSFVALFALQKDLVYLVPLFVTGLLHPVFLGWFLHGIGLESYGYFFLETGFLRLISPLLMYLVAPLILDGKIINHFECKTAPHSHPAEGMLTATSPETLQNQLLCLYPCSGLFEKVGLTSPNSYACPVYRMDNMYACNYTAHTTTSMLQSCTIMIPIYLAITVYVSQSIERTILYFAGRAIAMSFCSLVIGAISLYIFNQFKTTQKRVQYSSIMSLITKVFWIVALNNSRVLLFVAVESFDPLFPQSMTIPVWPWCEYVTSSSYGCTGPFNLVMKKIYYYYMAWALDAIGVIIVFSARSEGLRSGYSVLIWRFISHGAFRYFMVIECLSYIQELFYLTVCPLVLFRRKFRVVAMMSLKKNPAKWFAKNEQHDEHACLEVLDEVVSKVKTSVETLQKLCWVVRKSAEERRDDVIEDFMGSIPDDTDQKYYRTLWNHMAINHGNPDAAVVWGIYETFNMRR